MDCARQSSILFVRCKTNLLVLGFQISPCPALYVFCAATNKSDFGLAKPSGHCNGEDCAGIPGVDRLILELGNAVVVVIYSPMLHLGTMAAKNRRFLPVSDFTQPETGSPTVGDRETWASLPVLFWRVSQG